MTDHNQKLEPSRFDLNVDSAPEFSKRPDGESAKTASSAPGTSAGASAATSQKMTFAGLGALVLIACLVFFWLPERVVTPEIEKTPVSQQKTAPALPETTASPWSDAQLGRERKEAQEVLSELLEEQFSLEEIAVSQWAEEEFAEAQALATRGDELYRQLQFKEAKGTYQQGLESMRALSDSAPQVFEELLQKGEEALNNNQPELALETLLLATQIQPDSTIAQHSLERANNLGEVLALLNAAREARATQELETARDLLQQAVTLDPEHALAKTELADTKRAIQRRNFNRAMTAGYQAMDGGDFDAAEKQFLAAQRILPSAAETESALLDARTSRTRQQIDTLRKQADEAERTEQWQQAANLYQAILGIDQTVVFASAGSARSKARTELDKGLQKILDKPDRLSDASIYSRAQYLAQQAGSTPEPGPRLRQQTAQLNELLRLALTPIAVLLQSDEQTDVTVYRVAHLGTFARHQLELRPGTYTAVGVRNGYRDVRKKFTLSHEQASPVIDIKCTDRI